MNDKFEYYAVYTLYKFEGFSKTGTGWSVPEDATETLDDKGNYDLSNGRNYRLSDQNVERAIVVKVVRTDIEITGYTAGEKPYPYKIKTFYETLHPQALLLTFTDKRRGGKEGKDLFIDVNNLILPNNNPTKINPIDDAFSTKINPIDDVFSLEAVSDPQPDYDADFISISEKNGEWGPAHGSVKKSDVIILRFSKESNSIFTLNKPLPRMDTDFNRLNEILQNIDQDNLMVTLKRNAYLTDNPTTYKIPVLMTTK